MTAYSVLGPLQAAIYALLTGTPAFMALAKTVCDFVPETTTNFPYVVFGESTDAPFDSFGEHGSECTLLLHIWSRYSGWDEAQQINDALIGLLDNHVGLVIAGYTTVLLNFESSQQLRDPDGITRHIATRFRLLADAT